MGYVYFIGPEAPRPLKVGWSKGRPELRLTNLQVGNPELLKVGGFIEGPEELEALCHERLERYRIRGEWYERQGALDLLIDLIDLRLHGPVDDRKALEKLEKQFGTKRSSVR